MKILITGARGQLAYDLKIALKEFEVTAFNRQDFDLTNEKQMEDEIRKLKPEIIINTAASHNTDVIESNAKQAFEVNAKGIESLAKLCKKYKCKLIHISTDYVFGADEKKEYSVEDYTCPINVYGSSKALGERLIKQILKNHIIIRTSGLFGVVGPATKKHNFIDLMIKLYSDNTPITVVNDQHFSPTYTKHLALAIRDLCKVKESKGVFHITNKGFCSWLNLAEFALSHKFNEVIALKAQSTIESGAKASRPKWSVLSPSVQMPSWQNAVKEYLKDKELYVNGKYEF